MNITLILLISILSTTCSFGQKTAFINIFEEHTIPADGHTTIAQRDYTWAFNGKTLKYKTGKYEIPIKNSDQFDTIKFRKAYQVADLSCDKNKKPVKYDTATTVILCKFRADHNYKLGQLIPGHFELYSLDTFESKTNVIVKVINNKKKDTVYIYDTYPQRKAFSDTSVTILDNNERLMASCRQHIEFTKTERAIWFNESASATPQDDVFDLYYNFLHGEDLAIEFDASTNKSKISIRPQQLDHFGTDSSNTLNSSELNYIDSLFQNNPNVNFKDQKLIFINKASAKIISKKEFFDDFIKPYRNKNILPSFSTRDVKPDEKRHSGGYDFIFIAPSGDISNKDRKKVMKELEEKKK